MGSTGQNVLPGQCADYPIEVTKHYTSGYLVFTTPGGPEERPPEITESTWRYDNWVVTLSVGKNEPILWQVTGGTPETKTVNVQVCAPYNATAGLGESITVKAHLDGAPKVRALVTLATDVIQEYELEASVPQSNLDLYPGQSFQLNTTIENTGNGPDRFDVAVNSILDSNGMADVWDIEIPRVTFEELDRDTSQGVPIYINVPEKTFAGNYEVTLDVLSEEPYEGTRPVSYTHLTLPTKA